MKNRLLNSIIGILLLASWLTTPASAENLFAADPKIMHVLNRLSFGPTAEEITRVRSIGIDSYIREQLNPEYLPFPSELKYKLDSLTTLRMTPVELFKEYGPPQTQKGQKPDPQVLKEARKRAKIIMAQAVEAKFDRAIESPRQLEEVMVDFWYNHFNVYDGKGLDYLWAGAFEEQAIRPHVLGRFRDLLGATAKHPAMLFYLDNWKNSSPGSPGAKNQFKGLNENYARELMELHTLGVDGGYTQQDVITLAQILTGWGIRRAGQKGDAYGFYFDKKRHDFSNKIFLGYSIQGSGQTEVEQALDILSRSPATAHHISYQLVQFFVSDEPDPALVEQLSKRFLETDGDIRAVLDSLFHSEQFWDPKNYGAKFKTPFQFVISSIRASGSRVDNYKPLYGWMTQLGMPLYGCQTPDGFKNTQDAWLNPDSMIRRVNFATALANGKLKINSHDSELLDSSRLSNALGNSFSEKTQKAIESSPPRLRASLILGSPEFMRH